MLRNILAVSVRNAFRLIHKDAQQAMRATTQKLSVDDLQTRSAATRSAMT